MNEGITEKCGNPIYFESIKYAVHTLEGTLFDDKIKELLEINPYLATLCYVTSEYNEELEQYIIDFLSKGPLDSTQGSVLLYLSFALLGLKKDCFRIIATVTNKKNKFNPREWKAINPYYENQLYESLLKNSNIRLLSRYFKTTHQKGMSEEEKQELLQGLYSRYDWPAFFYALEEFSLYSFLEEHEEYDFMKNVPLALNKLYRKGRLAGINAPRKKICDAGRKVITIYLLQDNSLLEQRYNEIQKITLYTPGKGHTQNDFALMMKDYFDQFTIINICSVYDIPDGYQWDKKRNGISKPYKAYCDDNTWVWWIDQRGKSIKSTLRNIYGSEKNRIATMQNKVMG